MGYQQGLTGLNLYAQKGWHHNSNFRLVPVQQDDFLSNLTIPETLQKAKNVLRVFERKMGMLIISSGCFSFSNLRENAEQFQVFEVTKTVEYQLDKVYDCTIFFRISNFIKYT